MSGLRYAMAIAAGLSGSAAAADEIRIGVSAPASGAVASYGAQIKAAAAAFVAETNSKGGLLGRTLALNIQDDECSPKTAKAVSELFASDPDIDFVLGPLCSGAASAARDTYVEADRSVLQFTLAQGDVTGEAWPDLWRINPSNQAIARGMAAQVEAAGLKKVALFHGLDAYGLSVKQHLESALGGRLLTAGYEARNQDFRSLRDRLLADGAQGFLIAGYTPEISMIVNQIREVMPDMPVILSGTGTNSDVASAYGCRADDVGLDVIASDDGSLSPGFAAASRAMAAQGMELRDSAVMAWAALEVWAQAVREAGTTAPESLRRVLTAQSLPSLIGPMRFIGSGARYGFPEQEAVRHFRWECTPGASVPALVRK